MELDGKKDKTSTGRLSEWEQTISTDVSIYWSQSACYLQFLVSVYRPAEVGLCTSFDGSRICCRITVSYMFSGWLIK